MGAISLPHTRHTLRVFGAVAGLAILGLSLYVFGTHTWRGVAGFVRFMWLTLFALLAVFSETDMECTKNILSHFTFLTTDIGRGVFFLFLGTTVLDDEWWSILIGCVCIGVGGFHLVFAMLCEGSGAPEPQNGMEAAKPTSTAREENPFSGQEGAGGGGGGGSGGNSYAQPYGAGSGSGGNDNPFAGNAHMGGGSARV